MKVEKHYKIYFLLFNLTFVTLVSLHNIPYKCEK